MYTIIYSDIHTIGLCVLCPSSTNSILAFPGQSPGQVELIDLGNTEKGSTSVTAHETSLSCISMNLQVSSYYFYLEDVILLIILFHIDNCLNRAHCWQQLRKKEH